MPGPLALLGLAASTASSFASIRDQRKRAKEMADKKRKEVLEPISKRQRVRRLGLTTTEGGMREGAVTSTLQNQAQRGTLDSSFSAPAVRAAELPFEAKRAQELDDLAREKAAAASEIISLEGSAPGYEAAFAGGFGQAGQLFAMESGRKQAMTMFQERLAALGDFYKQTGLNPFGEQGGGGQPGQEFGGIGVGGGTGFGAAPTGTSTMVGEKRSESTPGFTSLGTGLENLY